MVEKRIGIVDHYYPKAHAASVKLEDDLHLGDRVHIVGPDVDLVEKVESMEIDRKKIDEAHPGDHIGLEVEEPVQKNAEVYRIE